MERLDPLFRGLGACRRELLQTQVFWTVGVEHLENCGCVQAPFGHHSKTIIQPHRYHRYHSPAESFHHPRSVTHNQQSQHQGCTIHHTTYNHSKLEVRHVPRLQTKVDKRKYEATQGVDYETMDERGRCDRSMIG